MKTILIPTDFSKCANNAAILGIELAKKTNAEVHFLHILRTPVDWKNLRKEQEQNFPETLHEIAHVKAELTSLEKKAKEEGINVKTFLVFDKDNDEIIDHLEQPKHDFIVMGSHGTKGIREIIGSNAQNVVRKAPCPVLITKEKTGKTEFKNIVFASDFREEIGNSFKKIVEFANLFKAKIHLLYVNKPFSAFEESDVSLERMKAFMKHYPSQEFGLNIFNALNEDRGIQGFSSEVNADLIAMVTHGKSGFLKTISPSITESLVNHSSIPVLSINTKHHG